MRLFAAIRPPREALAHLDGVLEPIRRAEGLTLRWGDPGQWHLTLAFAPAVPDGALDDVVAHLSDIAARHDPLELHLAGAGEFGHRTLWIGVGGEVPALERLLGEPLLEPRDGPDASGGHGGSARDRHRAHLTVARVSARAPQTRRRRGTRRERAADPVAAMLRRTVHTLSVYRGPAWTAAEIEVVASHLGQGRSGGPLHEVLARVPLA